MYRVYRRAKPHPHGPVGISGAPLLAGNNLATMSTATAGRPDQLRGRRHRPGPPRSAGRQGRGGHHRPAGLQQGPLRHRPARGRAAQPHLRRASITARWTDLGLTGAAASVRDIWTGADRAPGTGYTATVPAGEAVLLTVAGARRRRHHVPGDHRQKKKKKKKKKATAPSRPVLSYVTADATGTKLADLTYANGGTAPRTVAPGQRPVRHHPGPAAHRLRRTHRTVSVLLSLAKGAQHADLHRPAAGHASPIQDIPAARTPPRSPASTPNAASTWTRTPSPTAPRPSCGTAAAVRTSLPAHRTP